MKGDLGLSVFGKPLHGGIRLPAIILSVFAGYWIYWFYQYYRVPWNYSHYYPVTDALINYQAGFIRRGLLGEILFQLATRFGLPVRPLIYTFFGLSYFLLSAWFAGKVWAMRVFLSPAGLVKILFLPSLILFPLYDISALFRREIVFPFFLLLHAGLLEEAAGPRPAVLQDQRKGYVKRGFLLFGVLGTFLVLYHEASLFTVFPVNIVISILYLRRVSSSRYDVLRFLPVIYAAPLLAAAAVILFHGTQEAALLICRSWEPYFLGQFPDYPCGNLPGAFSGLSLSLRATFFKHTLPLLKTAKTMLLWACVMGPLFLINLGIVSGILRSFVRKTYGPVRLLAGAFFRPLAFYVLMPYAFSLPLYLAGFDWGRWFFVTSLLSTICFLSPALLRLALEPSREPAAGGPVPQPERDGSGKSAGWSLAGNLIAFACLCSLRVPIVQATETRILAPWFFEILMKIRHFFPG